MYDQLINLISNFGFPIAVSIYLLTRMDSKLDLLIKTMHELKEDISAVIKQN